jgi:hypothetical protein
MGSVRAGLLASVAATAFFAVSTAQAQTVPTVEELYKLYKEQQKLVTEQNRIIVDQQRRIQELERRAAKSDAEIARTRQSVKATTDEVTKARRDVEATRKQVDESKTVMATKTDLDRTKAELGTQPSQSVFRVDPAPPGWFAMGEFIYMRPTTDIVAFNLTTFSSGFSQSSTQSTSLDHSHDPGFRVGFGYRFPGGADVKFAYTFLRASSTTTAENPGGQLQNLNSPTLSLFQTTCCATDITAQGEIKYKLHYDVVDAEAGLNFMVGSHLRMRGSAGLRFVRIDQKLEGGITTQQGVNSGFNTADAHADFWGVGPRLALAGMWDMGWGFGIDGRFGGTLAVGASDNRTSRQSFVNGSLVSQQFTNGPSSARLVPGVDASLALTYMMPLGGTMSFKAAIGYEFAHWFNLRGFAGGEGTSQSGLSLDGFFVRAGVKW